jgi:hypothetical protein
MKVEIVTENNGVKTVFLPVGGCIFEASGLKNPGSLLEGKQNER